MARLTIFLNDDEWDALVALAVDERRDAREQAAHLVSRALGFPKPVQPVIRVTVPGLTTTVPGSLRTDWREVGT